MNHSGTSDPIFSRRSTQTILILSLALFIALAAGSLMTKRPWSDAGWFASVGFTLAEQGHMGTPAMDKTGNGLTGIKIGNQRDWQVSFHNTEVLV